MIICSCNVLSDHQVRTAMTLGAPPGTIGEFFRYLGSDAQCGRCARSIKRIMDEHLVNVRLLPAGSASRGSP